MPFAQYHPSTEKLESPSSLCSAIRLPESVLPMALPSTMLPSTVLPSMVLPVMALLAILLLASAPPVAGQGPRLVEDTRPGTWDANWSTAWSAEHEGVVFLAAGDSLTGFEIQRLENDRLIPMSDLCTGDCSPFEGSSIHREESFAFFGDHLYFVSDWWSGAPLVRGLWRIALDGSQPILVERGTVTRPTLLGDRLVYQRHGDGDASSEISLWAWDGESRYLLDETRTRLDDLLQCGEQAFFLDGALPRELWATDGSSTYLAAEIPVPITDFYCMGDRVVLEERNTFEVWISDGTASGTWQLTEFPSSARALATTADRTYFAVPAGSGVRQLWTSDGTPGGTFLPVYCETACHRVTTLPTANIGDLVFFFGDSSTPGEVALWRTDGTPTGTFRLGDATRPSFPGTDDYPKVAGRNLFFLSGTEDQPELWVSDGSVAGTEKLMDLRSEPRLIGAVGNRMIFVDYDRQLDRATLHSSNGTASGYRTLLTTPAGIHQSGSDYAAIVGNLALLRFRDESGYYRELWATDGSAGGTRKIDAPHTVGKNASPSQIEAVGDRIYFSAERDDQFRPELWQSRGTPPTTRLVGLGLPTEPRLLTSHGNRLFLMGGSSLWVTDGTVGGTRKLATLPFSYYSVSGVMMGDRLVVAQDLSDNGTTGTLLWISDGTPSGTKRIALIDQPTFRTPLLWATDDLVFVRTLSSTGLWRTDGTEEGTFWLGPDDYTSYHHVLGSRIYFRHDSDLWVSDGTLEGTRPSIVGGVVPGLQFVSLVFGADTGLYLLGPATNPTRYRVFWSDGSPEGTRFVGDLPTRFSPSRNSRFTAFGDRLVLTWPDAELGEEPWILSPNSPPERLADICAGPCSSDLEEIRTIGDRIYFAATDGVNGREPWTSDLTRAGTYRIGDIAAGPMSSEPAEFAGLGDEVFFRARDRQHGEELWAFDPRDGGASALLASDRFEVTAHWQTGEVEGRARTRPFSADTSFFWFFDSGNEELMVKVLDGSTINDHYWVFYGATSDVEYTIDVRDRLTGATRSYTNPRGTICGLNDTLAFPARALLDASVPEPTVSSDDDAFASLAPTFDTVSPFAPVPATSARARAKSTCTAGEDRLCLQDGRFRVEVDWRTADTSGAGQSITGTNETGYFWFFDPANVELAVKVLDGTAINGKFWVFYGSTSDVEYTLTVTDTSTGAVAVYQNPAGEICGFNDVEAF